MKPLVIGIGGGTASGKSTLADELASSLGDDCLLVLHDRYYRDIPKDVAHTATATVNFDHPDALETERLVADLESLRAGRPTRLPRYDFATHSRHADEDLVHPRPYLVVEGILVLADERLRRCFDKTVFVDTPDDIRLIRRIRRDVASRGRTAEDVMMQYLLTVRPMHEQFVAPSRAAADLVVDGTRPIAELVAAVAGFLGVRPPAGL